jgi:hypothetical protein
MGQYPVAFCEQSNEPLGSIKAGNFDQLNKYILLKEEMT